MFIKVICVVLFVCLASETFGKPTIYKRNEDNIYEPGDSSDEIFVKSVYFHLVFFLYLFILKDTFFSRLFALKAF